MKSKKTLKDIVKRSIIGITALVTLAQPLGILANPFNDFNKESQYKTYSHGRDVKIYTWDKMPTIEHSANEPLYDAKSMFGPNADNDERIYNYAFGRRTGRDDNADFFKKLKYLMDHFSQEYYGKNYSELKSIKESTKVIAEIISESKEYGNFIAATSGDQRYVDDFETDIKFPNYYGQTVWGSVIKNDINAGGLRKIRAMDYLRKLNDDYFDEVPLDVLTLMKYGVCRNDKDTATAFHNFGKTFNPYLKNTYLLGFSSKSMWHAWNMGIDITDSSISTFFVDITYYNGGSSLNATDDEHFDHPARKNRIFQFVMGGTSVASTFDNVEEIATTQTIKDYITGVYDSVTKTMGEYQNWIDNYNKTADSMEVE